MASDQSAVAKTATGEVTVRITLDSTIDDLTAITLPTWCREIDMYIFEAGGTVDEDGKFATAGADSAAVGTVFFPVPAGQGLTRTVAPGRSRAMDKAIVYVAADSASALLQLVMRAF